MRTPDGAALFRHDINARMAGMPDDMEVVLYMRCPVQRYRGGFLGIPGFFKNAAQVDALDEKIVKSVARLAVLEPIIQTQEAAWRESLADTTGYHMMPTTPETSERCDLSWEKTGASDRLEVIPIARKLMRATRPLRMALSKKPTAENV